MLQAAVPTINNLSDLHTQVIINQLNEEEFASVENANSPTGTLVLGTDLGQFVGVRSMISIGDIIDIASGATRVVQALVQTRRPSRLLNSAPARAVPQTVQTKTAYLFTQWIKDSNHLGQIAQTIANNGLPG